MFRGRSKTRSIFAFLTLSVMRSLLNRFLIMQTSPEHILLGLMAESDQEGDDGYLGFGVDVRGG